MNWLKSYFTFHKREKRGIIAILILLFAVIAVNIARPLLITREHASYTSFSKEIAAFEKDRQSLQAMALRERDKRNKDFDFYNVDESAARQKLTPFNFNPNNLPEESWRALGFTGKEIRMIKNYEKKGGKFYRKEDVKKLYCISEEEYKILEPYIVIPQQQYQEEEKPRDDWHEKIELNSADSATLLKIRGVGPVFASRIIKYRDALGGFYATDQLMEIFGMDSAKFSNIKALVTIDTLLVAKININTAASTTLVHHPYISYEQTKAIQQHLQKKGPFHYPDHLRNSHIFTDSIFRKIIPYVVF